MTKSAAARAISVSDAAQTHACLAKIVSFLAKAGPGLDSIVELTRHHVSVRRHFDLFHLLRHAASRPYPAWTAVGVAWLSRIGTVVHIRAVAVVSGNVCLSHALHRSPHPKGALWAPSPCSLLT